MTAMTLLLMARTSAMLNNIHVRLCESNDGHEGVFEFFFTFGDTQGGLLKYTGRWLCCRV